MTLGFSSWWIIGWAVGFGGAVIAAILLMTIIRLGRTVASEARSAREAIDDAQANTASLFDLTRTNLALDQLARGLHGVRRERSP